MPASVWSEIAGTRVTCLQSLNVPTGTKENVKQLKSYVVKMCCPACLQNLAKSKCDVT